MSDLEVLIPHHRGRESLRLTLASLAGQTAGVEVCVADNGSDDGSREMLAAEHPDVRVVELGSNRGFGAAVNAAARTSACHHACGAISAQPGCGDDSA